MHDDAVTAAASSSSASSRTFVCGNYQLDEVSRQKSGRIYLYEITPDNGTENKAAATGQASAASAAAASSISAASASNADSASSDYALAEQQVLDTAAIFDLKWSPQLIAGKQMLGQVDASGAMLIYEHRRGSAEEKSSLHLTHTTQVVDSASCLSLDWSNKRAADDAPTIAISQSNASLSLWSLTPSGVVKLSGWVAHEYEVWIAHLSATDPSILYSGADDCKFKGWDTRQRNHARSALFVDSSHEMGVCSIASHPLRDHILATGSYDESLRIWDVRRMDAPVLKVEHALGGGVWRVRWNVHPARQDHVLAAAMHNGFAVVSVDFTKGEGEASASRATVAAAEVESASNQLAASSLGDSAAAVAASSSAGSSIAATAADAPAVSARTVAVYKAHSSLAYGADWISKPCAWASAAASNPPCPSASTSASSSAANPGLEDDLIATCSFYDKQLDVWTICTEIDESGSDSSGATSAAGAAAAVAAAGAHC